MTEAKPNILELAKQELKTLIIPKGHIVHNSSTNSICGYTIANLSRYFYLEKKDDNFEKTNKLSCEIRFHIRSLNEDKLSATLWLDWENLSLKRKVDLFDGENYKSRFIYADNFKELFEKLESDVAEIDKRILDVQTTATPKNKEITDPVLAYMNSSQELLRAVLSSQAQ